MDACPLLPAVPGPLPAPDARMSEYAQRTERHIEKTDTHAHKVLTDFQLKAAEAGVEFTGLICLNDRLAFGAYHLTPAKILPTAFLGLGFGLPRLFIPSLWPSIAAHLCNNALVIILVRRGLDDAPLPGWLAIGALLAAAIAAALITRVSVRNPGLR